MEQENSNNGAENSSKALQPYGGSKAEASTKAESSKKRIHKSLKAKSNVVKKSSASNSIKAKNSKGNPQAWRRNGNKKNKNALQGSKKNGESKVGYSKKLNTSEGNSEKNGSNKKHTEKDPEIQKEQEGNGRSSEMQQNQTNKEKSDSLDRTSRKQKEKTNHGDKEKKKGDKKSHEKLGGLIFMCSAKTKPDVFRYRVMGVTSSKKDLVLGVKPGLKLFLYDFDLKLMYGVYQASSSGGMRLEPKAFGGSFPVQVRFNVYKDCLPITESVFKKAIKDNYDEKNKFDVALSVRQARKLTELFRPAQLGSAKPAAAALHSQTMATYLDRETYRGRESRIHSDREALARANGHSSGYPSLPRERDQYIERQEMVSAQREQIPHNLFMTEKEYRTYGLQGDRRNQALHLQVASIRDPKERDRETEHLLRQPVQMYEDAVPMQREALLVDPLYASQRGLSHNLGTRHELPAVVPSLAATTSGPSISALELYRRDPYSTHHYGASVTDTYVPSTKEEVPTGSLYVDSRRELIAATDPLGRRDEQGDKLYSKYAFDALAHFNQAQPLYSTKPEEAPPVSSRYSFSGVPPVSSRYSFAGPSMFYRGV